MVSNIDKCMKVAEDLGMNTQMKDIILVTGCHLARSWVNVTFSENQGDANVTFGIRRPGPSEVHFDEWNVKGGDVKFGPQGKVSIDMRLGFQSMRTRGPDTSRISRIYPRTNAYLFGDSTSSLAWDS
jgi:hypothetical protein